MRVGKLRPLLQDGPSTLKVLLLFGFIIVLLGGGLAANQAHVAGLTAEATARSDAEERSRLATEQVRSSNRAVIAAVRAFFILGLPALAQEVEQAEADYQARIENLRATATDPGAARFLAEIEAAGAAHRQAMRMLVAEKTGGLDAERLARDFNTVIVPPAQRLERALGAFAENRAARAQQALAEAERRMERAAYRTAALTLALIAAAAAAGWYFATLLAGAYRDQQAALAAARRAAAARDELLAVVAHDLRSPLTAVKLSAAAIRSEGTAEQRQHAAAIETLTGQMTALADTMLEAATIEAGRLTVSPAPCEADLLVRLAGSMFAAEAQANQVALKILTAGDGLRIMGDADRLLRVFSNLLANALKFTPAGGRITIGCERVAGAARFAVSNTGPGIPADELPHIFDRYWKGRRQAKPGSGLGLFIAKGIVEAHGGALDVTSAPPGETTFAFALPLAAGDALPPG